MKTNLITVGPRRLFNVLTSEGAIKVKDAVCAKIGITNVEFDKAGNLKWREGDVQKTFTIAKIAKFYELKHYEVYEYDGKLELLMWDEKNDNHSS